MEITIPYQWTPAPHQLSVLQRPQRFQVLVMHRKAWKTTLAINQLIRWAIAAQGVYWYIAPFLNQAKKIVWQDPGMLPRYCPPSIWEKRNNSELTIPFPNGSILQIIGADHPDSLRGPNPRGVILDEYGDMKSEVWSGIIQPVMIANPDAWCWFVGTPRGRNDFFQKFQYAKTSEDKNWAWSYLPASQSGIISREGLEEARKTTTQAFYDQEYECLWLEGAGQFFHRIRENTYEGRLFPDPSHYYRLGVDLAKYQDWTVLSPFDLNTFKAHHQERFNQVEWSYQRARIEAAHHRFNRAKLRVDASGVGDPIVEDLTRDGIMDAEGGFKFTEESRRQLLKHLAILLESDRIKIPNDEGLIEELESFRYELGDTGKVKITVPEGLHDDRVVALALAVWGESERTTLTMHTEERQSRERDEPFDPHEVI